METKKLIAMGLAALVAIAGTLFAIPAKEIICGASAVSPNAVGK